MVLHRIALHIPTWQQPAILQMVIDHIKWLNNDLTGLGIELWPFFIRSPEDPEPYDFTTVPDGWEVVSCKNQPLGSKWNYGVAAAYIKHKQFHSFMSYSANTLVSSRYIMKAVQALSDGAMVVGIGQCIFHDMYTGEAGQVNPGVPFGYGPARVYSLDMMRLLQWRLVDNGQKRNMERTIDCRLKELKKEHGFTTAIIPLTYGTVSIDSGHVTMVDLKTRTSINGFDEARKARKRKGHWYELNPDIVSTLYPHLKLGIE